METENLQHYISRRIRTLRKSKNLSQEKLSEKAELGINYIYNIENNAFKIRVDTLDKIIVALGITHKDFFNFDFPHDSERVKSILSKVSNLSSKKQENFFNAVELLLENMK